MTRAFGSASAAGGFDMGLEGLSLCIVHYEIDSQQSIECWSQISTHLNAEHYCRHYNK